MPLTPGQKNMVNMQWGRVSDDGSGGSTTYNDGQGGAPLIDSRGRVWVRVYGTPTTIPQSSIISPDGLTLIPAAGVIILDGSVPTTGITRLYVFNTDTQARYLQIFQQAGLPLGGAIPDMSIPVNPQGLLPEAFNSFFNGMNTLVGGNSVNTGFTLAVSSTFATFTALGGPVMYYSYSTVTP